MRPDVARFLLNLEPEVASLQRQLMEGSYVPGPYRTFVVKEAKPRLISAAPATLAAMPTTNPENS